MKKIKYLLITIFMFLSFIPQVFANNNEINLSKKGTITITLNELETNKPLEGVNIKLYKVASLGIKDNNLNYTYEKGFLNCSSNLSNLNNLNSKDIENCLIEKDSINQIKTTNKSGKVEFLGLDLGLYLAVQENKLEGYSTFDSFLITLPENINDKWNYNVLSKPKTDIYELMDFKVQKMWFNMYFNIPDTIEIALMKGDEVVLKTFLGNHNDWTYTFKDIPKSDDYHAVELNVPKGFKVVYKDYSNVFMIINIDYLAQTGQNIILVIILFGLGLILIFLGIIFIKRKKYE